MDSTSFHNKHLNNLNYSNSSDLGLPQRRALIHQFIKNEVVMDGFVDVILGINAYKKELIKLVDNTFRLTSLKDPFGSDIPFLIKRIGQKDYCPKTSSPIFITSGSLGSDIIYEYLSNSKNLRSYPYWKSTLQRLKKYFSFQTKYLLFEWLK